MRLGPIRICPHGCKHSIEHKKKALSCIQEELKVTRKILLACGSVPDMSLSVLRRLMPHDLLPVSPALFERTGTGAGIWLRTGSKAALVDSIRMLSASDSWPSKVAIRPEAKQAVLLDFMAFIRTRVPSKTETFENFAYRYDGLNLIKDPEGCPILLKKSSGCHSRKGEGAIRTFVISRSVTLENWELMLTQSSTKAKIAELIFEIWKDQTENTPFPLVLAGGLSDRCKKTFFTTALKASVLDKLEKLTAKVISAPQCLTEFLDDLANIFRKIDIVAYEKRYEEFSSLNDLRVHLFHKKSSLKCLPQTENTFKYHVKRAAFQWSLMLQASEARPYTHSPLHFGWAYSHADRVVPITTTLLQWPSTVKGVPKSCSCKSGCA
ncbi:hypothetical protein QYM36_018295 [Artemia franciscana]|uniref:Uncharacterized protein n=1 Tax=Artemia franciscana TaxID=6661 RepID=A0AA88KUQ9_ARTSF|nr:hypothetical protein QYM36_018295 [Artemia franciscana]